MKTPLKLLIVGALAALVAIAVVLRERGPTDSSQPSVQPTSSAPTATAVHEVASPPLGVAARLPRLVDLGAEKCIPCKMMTPILEELRQEYSDQFTTEFIDVWKNPDAGKQYDVEMIPTQIFFDADGKERFRHVGFIGKEDILAQWKELGVVLKDPAEGRPNGL